jgi:hypothetical protein
MIRDAHKLLERLRHIHGTIRDHLLAACERASSEELSAVVGQAGGDTIFQIDRLCEEVLLEQFSEVAREWPCVLIAEGLGDGGQTVLPRNMDAARAELRILVDPIDGTRGLMYQKRPAWILTGVAPDRGPATCLADIELAVQTEIPLLKQHLSDQLWTQAGEPACGERFNRLTAERVPVHPAPSQARTIAHGFGSIVRYFAGVSGELGTIDDKLVERVLGAGRLGEPLVFEDQYVSTGGQLYELLMAHDRWVADLRPLLEPVLRRRGQPLGHCCHPYDLCTELIARQAGVEVTDEYGRQLRAPLDVTSNVTWIGYANRAIREQVEPELRRILEERGLLQATGPDDVAH